MSLKVWLPFDGNLNNYGCGDVTAPTYNNLTLVSNGKIGQCYSGQAVYHLTNELLGNIWSLCAWIKADGWYSSNNIILCKNAAAGNVYQFYFSIIGGTQLRIGINNNSGIVFNYTFNTGTWYHVAATYDGSIGNLYINGELKKSSSVSNAFSANMNNIGINCRSANADGTTRWIGDSSVHYINDARIYDHCLSIAEIKEISQGLVLHYKLDDITNGIQDSSGYNHNGILYGTNQIVSDSPRYSCAIALTSNSSHINVSDLVTSGFGNSYSFVWWANSNSTTGMHWGFSDGIRLNALYNGKLWNTGDSSNNPLYKPGTTTQVTVTEANVWHHWAMVGDGSTCKVYKDGVHVANAKTYKAISGTSLWFNGWQNSTNFTTNNLVLSDFRLYATALNADAIRQLYELGAKIDNKGEFHTYELSEQSPNILFNVENARTTLVFANGLGKYTQSNCQVNLTKDGYHIYRPPNLTPSNDGNTMWGGLKLINQSTDTVSPYNPVRDNIWNLQKSHTYLFAFHVKGQSSGTNSIGFTNNMGWEVGGVSPAPTIIASDGIPANFNGEKDCFSIFTINDDIIKTSNDARGGYNGSSQYLSYRHFTFGWGYNSTGELGTDVYLTDFRLYDITNYISKFTKSGQAKFSDFVEQMDKCAIRTKSELLASNFIEF